MKQHRKKIIIGIVVVVILLLWSPIQRGVAYLFVPKTTEIIPESSYASKNTSQPDASNTATPKPSQPTGGIPASTPSVGGATNNATAKQLGIPASGTVLALEGMDFHTSDDMHEQFRGRFSRAPYSFKNIDYPRDNSKTSISTGLANLNAAIRSTPGTKIVLAHSQGAQVASGWMRQYATDKNAPKSTEVVFILSGNPLRSSGGYGIGKSTWDGTTGIATPTTTPWKIIDVARRYDGWADWPTIENNADAVKNANMGKITIHSQYKAIDIYNASHTVWTRGNTTFVLTKEEFLPIHTGKSNITPAEIERLRAVIESAYRRY